jgi:acyl carrier protein
VKPTLDRIIALIVDYGCDEDVHITAETRLLEDLQFDSLDLVEVVMMVEDEYGLEFSDDEAYGVVTVQDLFDTAIRLSGEST